MIPQIEWHESSGLKLLTDPQLRSAEDIVVAFSSRIGGVSAAPYASLNLALHVGDDPAAVLVNRGRLCEAIGLDVERLTCAEQVHGTRVTIVDEALVGRGHDSDETAIPKTDAVATNIEGATLAMFFADCVPVVLVDPVRRAVGIAHAGRKGVFGGVVPALLERMIESFGTNTAELLAYIGPSIGPCCYEVGDDLLASFAGRFGCVAGRDGVHLDLPSLVEKSLDDANVRRQNVAAVDICTADNTDIFYSYRSESGLTGRHAAIVSVPTQ